ncbi:MAG: DUF4325 domain-containing protein [Patescibacteria group bacterium]|nr:DUF4325 domain-containing protein [Patescibacteria group bacterium]
MDIKQEILRIAVKSKKFRTSDVLSFLPKKLSRQYISGVLSSMVKSGQLIRSGVGEYVYYALPKNEFYLTDRIHKRLINKDLKEHEVLDALKKQAPFIRPLRENIDSIFNYAFSEMLNNAIEHSGSKAIEIEVDNNRKILSFIVRDFGIGVFRNVMEKINLKSELEAIQDILKGKITTQPKLHSGEGIFFTSKVGDLFILESYNYRLRIDNNLKDIFVEKIESVKGTKVIFEISLDSKRHLNEVFKQYQTDPETYGFDKTEVHVKLFQMGTIYVSRSQARRVLVGLDKFKSVILDFDQVPTIGQAFADEIFRVFQSRHPEIEIKPINMNEAVAFMVGRVEKP